MMSKPTIRTSVADLILDLILRVTFYVGMPVGFVIIPILGAVWLWRHL